MKSVGITLFKFFAFFILFLAIMWAAPFEQQVFDAVSRHLTFDDAVRLSAWMDGEPAPEAMESVVTDAYGFLVLAVSVILFSLFTSGLTRWRSAQRFNAINFFLLWAVACIRRASKLLTFIVLMSLLFHIVPYDRLTDTHSPELEHPVLAAILLFHLLLTTAFYWLVKGVFKKGCARVFTAR
ncbi:hypothetical protein ACUY4R_001137 [Kosakonia sp. BK9b]|uniref:hypothetical protein n=1 Tax=Kosakonia sp. TaxID=1916651 RepID=UPI00289FBE0A|nr:hypothetical protein [Kosakonia sp.]